MKIIVGLGNPGTEYDNTRHNVGFTALDILAGESAKFRENKKFKALTYEDNACLFVKPLTFMNNSGFSVRAVLDFYGLLPKSLGLFRKKEIDLSNVLTVIHDDLDIEFGKFKTTLSSRSAGHRGVESIINHLKTQNFRRFRIGIKSAEQEFIPVDKFVLAHFKANEKETLKSLILNIKDEL